MGIKLKLSDFVIDIFGKGLEFSGIIYPVYESVNHSLDARDLVIGGVAYIIGRKISDSSHQRHNSYIRSLEGLGDGAERAYNPIKDLIKRIFW